MTKSGLWTFYFVLCPYYFALSPGHGSRVDMILCGYIITHHE
ncbi:MAG: hypothetical protein NTX53_13800 [candidate division WOR-3 bacterium]|nr:hypothetical protein [candidate division WOR-3 bacterium]